MPPRSVVKAVARGRRPGSDLAPARPPGRAYSNRCRPGAGHVPPAGARGRPLPDRAAGRPADRAPPDVDIIAVPVADGAHGTRRPRVLRRSRIETPTTPPTHSPAATTRQARVAIGPTARRIPRRPATEIPVEIDLTEAAPASPPRAPCPTRRLAATNAPITTETAAGGPAGPRALCPTRQWDVEPGRRWAPPVANRSLDCRFRRETDGTCGRARRYRGSGGDGAVDDAELATGSASGSKAVSRRRRCTQEDDPVGGGAENLVRKVTLESVSVQRRPMPRPYSERPNRATRETGAHAAPCGERTNHRRPRRSGARGLGGTVGTPEAVRPTTLRFGLTLSPSTGIKRHRSLDRCPPPGRARHPRRRDVFRTWIEISLGSLHWHRHRRHEDACRPHSRRRPCARP
jgi:hypothetical protein